MPKSRRPSIARTISTALPFLEEQLCLHIAPAIDDAADNDVTVVEYALKDDIGPHRQ